MVVTIVDLTKCVFPAEFRTQSRMFGFVSEGEFQDCVTHHKDDIYRLLFDSLDTNCFPNINYIRIEEKCENIAKIVERLKPDILIYEQKDNYGCYSDLTPNFKNINAELRIKVVELPPPCDNSRFTYYVATNSERSFIDGDSLDAVSRQILFRNMVPLYNFVQRGDCYYPYNWLSSFSVMNPTCLIQMKKSLIKKYILEYIQKNVEVKEEKRRKLLQQMADLQNQVDKLE